MVEFLVCKKVKFTTMTSLFTLNNKKNLQTTNRFKHSSISGKVNLYKITMVAKCVQIILL